MKTNVLAIVLVGILLASVVTVAAFDNRVSLKSNVDIKNLNTKNSDSVDENLITELVPETLEEAKEAVELTRIPRRFILWTHTGEDVMWGTYGNGYFFGEDNNDKKAWGIYYKGSFAGFYDGHLFYGSYRGYKWKAHGLFDMRSTYGEFRTFPMRPVPVLTATATPIA